MTTYYDRLCEAMSLCEAAGAVFHGQAVRYDGTGLSRSFRHLAEANLVELPVAEEMQLGMALGASLAGQLVVTCFPRYNFLLLAASQLVNHVDKLSLYSAYRPGVIIRVAVGHNAPLDPGVQHLGDFTVAFQHMCHTVQFVRLLQGENILPAYEDAVADARDGRYSTVLVEYPALYGTPA